MITNERSRSLSSHWPGLAGSFGHWLAVVLVIFQRPSCGLPYCGGFRFHRSTAPVLRTDCTDSRQLLFLLSISAFAFLFPTSILLCLFFVAIFSSACSTSQFYHMIAYRIHCACWLMLTRQGDGYLALVVLRNRRQLGRFACDME